MCVSSTFSDFLIQQLSQFASYFLVGLFAFLLQPFSLFTPLLILVKTFFPFFGCHFFSNGDFLGPLRASR